jgi:hypothetical protein
VTLGTEASGFLPKDAVAESSAGAPSVAVTHDILFNVNGAGRRLQVESRMTLAEALSLCDGGC